MYIMVKRLHQEQAYPYLHTSLQVLMKTRTISPASAEGAVEKVRAPG